MTDALEDHRGTVSIGGRTITNLRFADDIDSLVDCLDKTSAAFDMEISAEKTRLRPITRMVSALTSESTVINWTRLIASSIWSQSFQIRVSSLKYCPELHRQQQH